MAPTRRRERAARGGTAAGTGRDRQRDTNVNGNANADSDEEAPQYNIVSCAMRFTEEQQAKQQARATKIENEVKRMAADYSVKMDDLVLEEARELDQVWQKYTGESMEDDKSRRRLLNALAENYVQIERIVNTLQASLLGFEKKRFEAAASTLDKAQKETNASHEAFIHAVRKRKTAFNTRRIAGQKHAAAAAAAARA